MVSFVVDDVDDDVGDDVDDDVEKRAMPKPIRYASVAYSLCQPTVVDDDACR